MIPKKRSLNHYTLISWLIPGAVTLLSSIILVVVASYLNLKSEINNLTQVLHKNSIIVSRAISSEVLIGARGSVSTVSLNLKKELGLLHIDLTHMLPKCMNSENEDYCNMISGSTIEEYRKLPSVPQTIYSITSLAKPSFTQAVKPETLFYAIVPILIFTILGFLFQRNFIQKYISNPISELVNTTTGIAKPNAHWPLEIKEISDKLNQSFDSRDMEVFNSIVKGVIHDLRTLIQTPITALELLKTSSDDKKSSRIEHLIKVSETQLPKIKSIIDYTLDGSREISIFKGLQDIDQLIKQSLNSLEYLIKAHNIQIQTALNKFTCSVDPTQLERAITNIIKNAIEASIENKASNPKILIKSHKASQYLIIEVSDSGSGFKQDPSRTYKPIKSSKSHGSGLGLMITRKIIEAHGGKLEIHSKSQLGGALMQLYLPINEES